MSPRIHPRHKPRPLKHLSDAPRVWPISFRWVLSGYIVVSLVFFSASLYHSYHATLQSTSPWKTHPPVLSGIDFLSPAARLDKLVSLHPPPIHLDPFANRPVVDPHSHEVTACLWTTESNLDWVPTWTRDWHGNTPACGLSLSHLMLGPTSLVVVTHLPLATTHAPHPALTRLLRHPKFNASRLALHLLYLDLKTPEAPNVFLNLARLFAPTRTLFLVPGTPKPPPPSFISTLSMAHLRDPVVLRVAAPGPGTAIVVNKARSTTLAVLSPVLILRDHPLWCTERFAFAPAPSAPRAADWDACLWQIQLETFGTASSGGPALQEWRWNVEPESAEPALPSVPLTVSKPPLCISETRMGVDTLTDTVCYSPQTGRTLSGRDVYARDQAPRSIGRRVARRRPRTCGGAPWT